MVRKILVAGLLLFAVGCVSTVPNPQDDVRAQAWDQISKLTDATDLGGNRLRVKAHAAPGYDIESLETDLLARVAGEALRRGAARFAIVYVEYGDRGVGSLLSPPSYAEGKRAWIGTYEDLVAARTENDLDGSLTRGLRFKEVTVVVRLLAPGEAVERPGFSSKQTYTALIHDRIERRNIKPRRTLSFRR